MTAAVALQAVPRPSKEGPALSASLAASSISLPNLSVASPASSIPSPEFSMASLLLFSSRSIPLRAASALLSCICHAWVRLSFSPKESAAFLRAARRTSIFSFWASICLPSTSFLAVRASTDLSFLSNSDSTSFISEPRTLKDWLISARAFLNSFSPSSPILRPKSAI